MILFGLCGVPLVAALVVTVVARIRWANAYWMFAAGVAVAIGFVAFVYLRAAHNYESSGGVDGEMFLGRWWDPEFTVLLAFVGYIGWTIGTVAGALFNATSCRWSYRQG